MNTKEQKEIGAKLGELGSKIRDDIMEQVAPNIAARTDGSYRDALNILEVALPKIDKLANDILIERIMAVATPEQAARAQSWLKENGYGHLATPEKKV